MQHSTGRRWKGVVDGGQGRGDGDRDVKSRSEVRVRGGSDVYELKNHVAQSMSTCSEEVDDRETPHGSQPRRHDPFVRRQFTQ